MAYLFLVNSIFLNNIGKTKEITSHLYDDEDDEIESVDIPDEETDDDGVVVPDKKTEPFDNSVVVPDITV